MFIKYCSRKFEIAWTKIKIYELTVMYLIIKKFDKDTTTSVIVLFNYKLQKCNNI